MRGWLFNMEYNARQGSENRLDAELSWLQRMHMIEDTLAKIEARLGKTGVLTKEQRAELLGLLSTLKIEIEEFSKTHSEQAQSITAFTQASTHEATRLQRDPQLLQLSLEGLSASVQGFETSHPKLVEIVNAISLMLSNSGV